MSFLFLLIKLYPLFGLAMAILCFDLTRTYRRKANSIWLGFGIFTILFILSVVAWVYFRGDLHSQEWFNAIAEKFRD
jgi:hypothetical protein